MPTYLTHDDEGNARPVPFAKPPAAHTLTKGAKAARKAVRNYVPNPLTRDDVEAAYVHPEPEEPAHEVEVGTIRGADPEKATVVGSPLKSVSARRLAKAALLGGHRVKATRNRGTTPPKWWVNAPDSRLNPGPPVAADQYHGTLVTCETVYVVTKARERVPMKHVRREAHQIKGVWLDGRIDRVEVDGVAATLDAALEVLS